MRRFLIVLLLISSGLVFAETPDWLDKGKYVRFDDKTNKLDFIRFHPGEEIPFGEFNSWIKMALELGPDDDFRQYKVYPDMQGETHYRYQQYHRGIPVEYGVFIAHVKNGKVFAINGDYFPMTPSNGQALTNEGALASALTLINAQEYIWEQPGMDAELQMMTGDPNASYFPTGELVYSPASDDLNPEEYRLAYKFDVYSTKPLDRNNVYVDAENGNILHVARTMHSADSLGTAQTYYSGTQTITADYTGTNFRLKEVGRGNGIWTRDMNEGTNFSAAVDFVDADNIWNNVNTNFDQAAPDVHLAAEGTYDYLLNYLGMNSIDGNGYNLLMYVHYDNNWSNARWDGQRAMFGDGPGGFAPFGTFDVTAHEIGHGTIGRSANLIYQNESGALNESFADIQGVMVEYHYGPTPDWTIGEDIGTLRSLSNPKNQNNPDTYHGQHWEFTSFDNGGVHINSGVQNHWFYLLSVGGSGTNDNGDAYSITGITRDSAAAIAFRNLLVYLTPSSQYVDARFYAIQSAIDIYGECSPEMIETANAWYAVGVGSEWGPIASDFEADETEFCNGPATVNFTNKSVGSLSYFWDFGDFNFSSAESPTHTYAFLGTYSPRLVATGCATDKDTLIRQSYIVINTSQPCVYNMPQNGSGGTLTDCLGKLRDSGGNSDYLSSVNSTTTIAPTNAAQVTLDFTLFDFETSGDLIQIFDGPDVASPLIGNYNGTSLAGQTVTSTGGAITIKEITNAVNQKAGFVAEWNCTLVNIDDQVDETRLEIFPNPATGNFRIEYSFNGTNEVMLTVMDAYGKIVLTDQSRKNGFWGTEVNASNWAKGVYFVRIKEGNKLQTKKVVLQ